MRWPRPWRARKATSFPANFPTTYGSEGLPHGVSMVNSCCTSKPGIEYNPLPPIIPIDGFIPIWLVSFRYGRSFLYEFQQNAAGRRRMDENIKMAAGAAPGIVQQTRAARFQALDGACEIRHFDRNVMQSLTPLIYKFG